MSKDDYIQRLNAYIDGAPEGRESAGSALVCAARFVRERAWARIARHRHAQDAWARMGNLRGTRDRYHTTRWRAL